jgi:sugar/nucleoside kinase (ribokinase family)
LRTKVLFVGNATKDTILFVPHLPSDDEVSAVERRVSCFGGRGVVPAIVAASLGIDAELCTTLGEDYHSEFTEFLTKLGVRSELTKRDERNVGITEYFAFVNANNGSTVAAALTPNLDWQSTPTQLQAVKAFQIVYFSTNPPAFNLELLNQVNPESQQIVHNLGIRFAQAPQYIKPMLDKSHILIGNRHEFRILEELTGLSARSLIELGQIELVIATSGTQPIKAHVRGQSDPVVITPNPARGEVIPIGAGDSFAAGLIAALDMSHTIETALAFASKCGRLAAESYNSYPDLAAVRWLWKEL